MNNEGYIKTKKLALEAMHKPKNIAEIIKYFFLKKKNLKKKIVKL